MGRDGHGSSTRRRNTVTLLILAALLVAAAAGYALLPSLFTEGEDETTPSLLGVAAEEIETIFWEGDAGSGSIRHAASDSGEEESSWVAVGDESVELNGEACDELASALADATVTRTIPSEDVTEEMGLDDPDATVEVTLEDGSSLSLELSDPTGEGTESYVRLSGDDAPDDAYLVSSSIAQSFSIGIEDLYAMEASPSAYDIVDLTVKSAAGTLALTYHEGGDETLSYTSQYEWFAAWDDGTPVAVDETAATSLTGVVNYLDWESCVDPAYDGTTDYGFGEPTLTATLNYTKSSTENVGDTDDDGVDNYETVTTPGTFTLVVGDQTDNGSYYAQPEGSSKVYTVSADDVDELLGASAESMLPDDVCLIDWGTIESVEVTVGGETTSIELVRDDSTNGGESDDEDDEDEARADSYLVDGEEADADAVEELLDAIDALSSEGEADGETVGDEDPEVAIMFHRSTEAFETVILGFTRYDTSFYLASLNGDARLLVNKNDIANLKDLVGEL